MVTIAGKNRKGISHKEFIANDPRLTKEQQKIIRECKEEIIDVTITDSGFLFIQTEPPEFIPVILVDE